MNFNQHFQSNFLARAMLLASICLTVQLPAAAKADSHFKDLSAADREKVIRESIFAQDNPEHVVASAAVVVPPQKESEKNLQPAVDDRGPQPGGRGGPGYSVQQNNQEQPQNQYNSQRGYTRREKVPVQTGRPPGTAEENSVAVENGGVHINTGNNSIDRSVESFIDRKVRGAQSAIRSLWR